MCESYYIILLFQDCSDHSETLANQHEFFFPFHIYPERFNLCTEVKVLFSIKASLDFIFFL